MTDVRDTNRHRVSPSLMACLMRAQGWIQDIQAATERRWSFKAELLAPHEAMSPRLRQRFTQVFEQLEQAARAVAIAQQRINRARTMAHAETQTSITMNFLLERRAGRYFMVRFYDENKQEQRGK